jgi:hypothetical protein
MRQSSDQNFFGSVLALRSLFSGEKFSLTPSMILGTPFCLQVPFNKSENSLVTSIHSIEGVRWFLGQQTLA